MVRDFYLDIQNTAEKRMQEITLKDVLEQYHMKLEGMLLQRLWRIDFQKLSHLGQKFFWTGNTRPPCGTIMGTRKTDTPYGYSAFQQRRFQICRKSTMSQAWLVQPARLEYKKAYLINTSTLKEVFKAVYGLPIATYMKEYPGTPSHEATSGDRCHHCRYGRSGRVWDPREVL